MNAVYPYRLTVQRAGGYEDVEWKVGGPLYHGGRARLAPGGLITPGRRTNPWGDAGPVSVHVFFTANLDTAAAYAHRTGGRVYEVEPTGEFGPDRGGDDFKTRHPLRVVREVDPGR